jgi:hypothetical protein
MMPTGCDILTERAPLIRGFQPGHSIERWALFSNADLRREFTAGSASDADGPDGFLTSFAGEVVAVELTLANEGHEAILYTLTPNDYRGHTQTVTVKLGSPKTISWPTDRYGYYDVVVTTNTGGGFRRRYAGRIA